MTNERFFELMNGIDNALLMREERAEKKNRLQWMKWGSIAAIIVLAVTVGIWGAQSELLGGAHAVTLDSGDTLLFARGGTIGEFLFDLNGLFNCEVQFRGLTPAEAAVLADDFKFEGEGLFNGETGALLGFEGVIDRRITLQVSSRERWYCTVYDGVEQTSVVNGVPVTAGYVVWNRDRISDWNITYYATFKVGGQTVYLESGGSLKEREVLREELAIVIETLIDNGVVDLTQVHY